MDKSNTNLHNLEFQNLTENLPLNLLCFSHLRWDFVFQRPQQLLTRFAKSLNVYFFEEPQFIDSGLPHLSESSRGENIWILTPLIPEGISHEEAIRVQKELLDDFMEDRNLEDFTFWYYTPMALEFSEHLHPRILIYDCMDELSAFKFAPPQLKDLEKILLERAQVVFTGGQSLYEAKKKQHHNIHPFPSSIDKAHFAKARNNSDSPPDQQNIPHPRIGFFGVIDERFDIDLIRQIAEAKPSWQIVLIGPVVKIDPQTLPQRENIHYLGAKTYQELPAYLSGWNAALIPFLKNESTEFISPTKTPEYLAAGIPVVSSSIRDVVHPYGDKGLVYIADTPEEFIEAIEQSFSVADELWLKRVDDFLDLNSWDLTAAKMLQQLNFAEENKGQESIQSL